MEIARFFPPLGVGWGAAILVVAGAVRAASPTHQKISPAEAAMAAVLAAPFGLGAGLLALSLRDDGSQDAEVATVAGAVFVIASSMGLLWVRGRARNPNRTRPSLTWKSPTRLIVGLGATVLLTSVAVGVSSLITVPLMFWLVAGAHVASAVVLTLIAGSTVYIATWMLFYYGGDQMVATTHWVIPAAIAFTAIALFVRRYRKALHSTA